MKLPQVVEEEEEVLEVDSVVQEEEEEGTEVVVRTISPLPYNHKTMTNISHFTCDKYCGFV